MISGTMVAPLARVMDEKTIVTPIRMNAQLASSPICSAIAIASG